jgi:hypothetical protein
MTDLLDTVPARLVAMGLDSDSRIKTGFEYYKEKLDNIELPCVLVQIPETEYPATASNLEMPIEPFELVLIVATYGSGDLQDKSAEKLLRSIVPNIRNYFLQRPQLQFSDTLNAGASAAGPLDGVMFARLRKGPLLPFQRGLEEIWYWGCVFTINITEIMQASEIIV